MLTKAERRKIALKNLAKARKARKARKRNPVRGRRRGMRDEFAPDYYDYSADEADRRAAIDAKAAKKAAAKAKREEKKAAAEAKRAEKEARVKAAAANDTAKPKKAKKAAKKSAKKSTKRSKPVAKPKKASKSAKKSGSKKGKLTKAERAAISRRNLKKARAARKAGKVAAPKKSKKASKKAEKSGTRKAEKSVSTLSKRQRAARKAARARKRRPATARLTRKNRGITVNVNLKPTKAQRRALTSRGSSKRRKSNPITGGGEWFTGLSGFVLGGVSVGLFDRMAATHPLVAGQSGTTGAWNDAPAAGQLYNAEAVQAPIWSSVTRLLVAAVAIATPFGIAAAVKGPRAKTFFQLYGFGSLAVTAVKGINDVIALAASQSSFGARLYAPEIMAQSDTAALKVNGSPLPVLSAPVHTTIPSSPPSLAGLPRMQTPHLASHPQASAANVAVTALRQTPTPASPQGVAGAPTDAVYAAPTYLNEDFSR